MIARSIVSAAIATIVLATPSAAQTAAELLQKGIYTQETVGDLDAAIKIFRQVLTASSSPRELAAQAQGRIVRCFVAKGDSPAAAREFNKLARDYGQFKDVVRSVAPAVRGADPQRERVPLPNGPTRIRSAIRGTVRDDAGRPLRRAQVRVTAPELKGEPRIVTTDDDGRYEVGDLPPARYAVQVTRAGYLPLRYGQRRPREMGKPLQVLDGQVLESVDFMLPRMSVISGRITDEDHEPIADVLVFAMRSRYFDGRRQFIPTAGQGGFVTTDDEGEYRLVGLVPGTYVVMAQSGEKWSVGEDPGEPQMGYAPTYFPGTTGLAGARPITVGIGQEAANTDFALVPRRASTISGTAFDSRGRPFKSVIVAQEFRAENAGMFGRVAQTTVDREGRFTVANVAPGHYKLEASTMDSAGDAGETPEVAIVPIDAAGVDIDNAALVGSSGGFISGTIVADTGPTPKSDEIMIQILQRLLGQPEPLRLGTFKPRIGVGVADIARDGTFSIDHVFGPARFVVTLRNGWAVKHILRDGRDITDAMVDPKSGERLTGVQIVLTHRVTTLSGKVVDEQGAPTPDGTVVAFSADRDKWFEDSRFVQAVRPDQRGQFLLTGLPPGDYLVAALDDVEDREWFDPEYLESIQAAARRITLSEGEAQTATLKLAR